MGGRGSGRPRHDTGTGAAHECRYGTEPAYDRTGAAPHQGETAPGSGADRSSAVVQFPRRAGWFLRMSALVTGTTTTPPEEVAPKSFTTTQASSVMPSGAMGVLKFCPV